MNNLINLKYFNNVFINEQVTKNIKARKLLVNF